MSKIKSSYNKKYYEVVKEITNPIPYSLVTKKDFPKILCNDDTLQKLISALKNRKDADAIFITAILKSPRFWRYLLIVSIILSTTISYIFCHYYIPMNHIVEKTVNSKIPGLFPFPSQQK